MSFRRDGQAAQSWLLWVEGHREDLVRCGLPASLHAEEACWLRFLEHDGWEAETGWSVEMLAPGQAAHLADFIIREYGPGKFPGLLRTLARVTDRQ